ncbi:MAG: polysulfide reductase [Planctomycetota bacterium]|nr:MAG: polysulfide reductase [Planctomycetota bacterium]
MAVYLGRGHLAAAYGSYVPWGLWVACYSWLVGLSFGAFFVAAAAHLAPVRWLAPLVRLALVAALAAYLAGMLSIWLDLGRPERVWHLLAYTDFGSIMGIMAWSYTLYGCLLVAATVLSLARGRVAGRALNVLLGTGLVLSVAAAGAAGALFGAVGARPYWNEGILPLMFLFGAAVSGSAFVAAAAWLLRPDRPAPELESAVVGLGRAVLIALPIYLLLEWAKYSIVWLAAVGTHVEALNLVLFGPYWWVFWVVHLGLGVAVPLAVLAIRGRSPAAVAAACGLVAITFLAVRLNIVLPALAVEELRGLEQAFVHPRLSFAYTPTLIEWLVQIWIIGIAGIVLLAARRWLKLFVGAEATHG